MTAAYLFDTEQTVLRKQSKVESKSIAGRKRSAQVPQHRVRRILVVDDNLDYVHSMALILRGLGHLVYFAINGMAALEEARRFRPEVIFLDVGLPDGDGRLLARQLRRQTELETVRIMCVTGRANEDPGKSLEAGCDDHYLKPLDPVILSKLLESER